MALVHNMEVLFLKMEVVSVAAELKDVESHIMHHAEDTQVAMVNHVEPVLAALKMLIRLDGIVNQTVMFLPIIMVAATLVKTITANLLHAVTVIFMEGAMDAIKEPVLQHMVSVVDMVPVLGVRVEPILAMDFLPALVVRVEPILAMDFLPVLAVSVEPVLAMDIEPVTEVVELLPVDPLLTMVDRDHEN